MSKESRVYLALGDSMSIDQYLCYEIEPSLKGAAVIAGLFKDAVIKAGGI
jgi:hypothetical protein